MEIKKEELRIGNLLWEEYGGVYEVEGITQCGNVEMKKGGMTDTGLYSISRLKPIELTEEWLLKLGFWTISSGTDDGMRYIKGFELWKCNDLWLCNKNGVVIKSVHQLQNLYFALTGQELTIKND